MVNFVVKDNQGTQALDVNLIVQSLVGQGVNNGCAVTINTGNLGTGNAAINIGSGSMRINSGDVSVTSQNIDVPDADGTHPRRDVVYLDSTGTAAVRTGVPEAASPEGAVLQMTERPAPDDFDGLIGNYVPLAEVWVAPNVTTIDAGDIYDRRTGPVVALLPDSAAEVNVNETITGQWTFDQDIAVRTNRITGAHGIMGIGDGGAFNFDATSADFRFNTGLTDLLWIRNDGDMELPNGGFTQGFNPGDVITETTSPKSFNFDGGSHRDIHDQTNLIISNASAASATETITVELYDGIDTTGTLVTSESKSVTVAAGASSTVAFIAGNVPLDNGTYHIEVTQSGTTLSVDQADEYTRGASYTLSQNATGQLELVDQAGNVLVTVDPIDDTVTTSRKVISSVPNGESNFVATVPAVGEPAKYMIDNPDQATYRYVTLTSRDSEQYTVEATNDIDGNFANRKKLFGVDVDANFTAVGAVKARGSNICTESVDGNIREFYVSASAPSTSQPYVRFEP